MTVITPDAAAGIQQEYCEKRNIEYLPVDWGQKIGIADNVRSEAIPVNGLRMPPENGTEGWYLYSGEVLKSDVDFFKPVHLFHLIEMKPMVLKFLGLPPGYRFLTDGKYEDVWFDENLLSD